VAVAVVGLAGHLACPAALAFEETTIGGGDAKAKAAPALELPTELPTQLPKAPAVPSKGLNLSTPELQLTPGTEVRIPGLGKVGVLPKLDFGLELLYGANEQKGPFQDKTDPDDVQLRGTIKHRF
jgi:hypothetical protein